MGMGHVVVERLQKLGITQRDLAERSGLSEAEVSRIVSAERPNPGGQTLLKLARGLGITVDELLKATDFGTPADSLPEVSPSRTPSGRRRSGKPTAAI
ncbi:hypothetical protein LCGC14_1258450 [marine sediment metagenome]|uniref:HTH cro/C1-type domain-containing protein n=1 Tax=marine sediment metagenome TaxID=412755 RepID=A0A0F9L3V3_9ZZZZ